MKIVEGWWVIIRAAQFSGMVLRLAWPPVEAPSEAPPRLVALVRDFVVVPFSAVTPRRVAAAVGLAQMRLALAADLAADDLMAASQ
jgi:hypothetical protein